MTTDDLNQISELLDKKLTSSEKRTIGEINKRITTSEKKTIGEIDKRVTASEQRTIGEIDKRIASSESKVIGEIDRRIASSESKVIGEIDRRIASSESKVIGEIGKFMADHLLPQMDEKADKSDIDRLERKLDQVIDKNIELNNRVTRIESIPVIAHELKLKKSG